MHFITDVGESVIKELITFPGPPRCIPGFYWGIALLNFQVAA